LARIIPPTAVWASGIEDGNTEFKRGERNKRRQSDHLLWWTRLKQLDDD
jgi:hypothetical protein